MTEYNQIESLGEIEWLQHRPETYIGTTNHPTHLFEEVFDNALDEVLSGKTDVTIIIDKNDCTIKDSGRGFPVGLDDEGIPYPVKACTKLYTSGKFNKKVKAYKISAGLNGIGLVAVAGLSDEMTLISHRDGYAHEYVFKTDFTKNDIDYVVKDKVKSNDVGTSIKFTPSKKIFRSLKFDTEYIKERVHLAKMLTGAKITLIIDGIEIDVSGDKSKLLESFFELDGPSYSFSISEKDQTYEVFFSYDFNKNEPRFKGSVNLLPIHTGTHIKYLRDIFPDVVQEVMPNNKILSKSDYLVGIRCFVISNIEDPKFSGQTKDRLDIDVTRFDIFTKKFKTKLKKVLKDEVDIKALYERFIDYKNGLKVKRTTKKMKKRKFSHNLLDCKNSGPGTYLFIVEGESAAGSLMKCRERTRHAIFTLFGKSIPNVETAGAPKLLANKTVTDLFNILGKDHTLEVCEDISNIKYDKFMITTDPDIDGYHIAIMIMRFFNKFFPKIIEEKRLLLPQIPLYGYYDNKKFVPIYNIEEANVLMNQGKKLMRHKGLGEFDPEELEIVLFKNNLCIVLTKDVVKEVISKEDVSKDDIPISESIERVESTDVMIGITKKEPEESVVKEVEPESEDDITTLSTDDFVF